MFRWSLRCLIAVFVCAGAAQGQLAASLRIEKQRYVAGEPVIAIVTITNHAGKELIFQSDGRIQWLDFIVKTSNGTPVNPKINKLFGPMKIKAGQTLAREVDLTQYFLLSQAGNFAVSAVVRAPMGMKDGTVTNRAFFDQSNGSLYWSQRVGMMGSGVLREYRLLNFTGDSKSMIYAQVQDCASGKLLNTFPLGEVLMIRNPSATVDRRQCMHVLFLATPSMWVYCMVSPEGKLIERKIHQRGPVGDPMLLTFGDGSVRVSNSIPYDPKAEAEQRAKRKKASDRPAITY